MLSGGEAGVKSCGSASDLVGCRMVLLLPRLDNEGGLKRSRSYKKISFYKKKKSKPHVSSIGAEDLQYLPRSAVSAFEHALSGS